MKFMFNVESCVYDKYNYDNLISLLDFGHTVFSYNNGNIIKCATYNEKIHDTFKTKYLLRRQEDNKISI